MSAIPNRRDASDLDLSARITGRLPLIREAVAQLVRSGKLREDKDAHTDLLIAIELLQEASARLILKATRTQ